MLAGPWRRPFRCFKAHTGFRVAALWSFAFLLVACAPHGPLESDSTAGDTAHNQHGTQAEPAIAIKREQAFQKRYQSSSVLLAGRITTPEGIPVANAEASLFDSVGKTRIASVTSDTNGNFEIPALRRRNALLKVTGAHTYPEWIPVALHVPLSQPRVNLGDIEIVKREQGRVRLTFAGDVMFARRFYDHDQDGQLGESPDRLHVGSIEPDTLRLFEYMQAFLQADDHSSVNLETTLLDRELKSHPKNRITFFSRSPSAKALSPAGIDSVSLGNNHIFDYLTPGVDSTISALDKLNFSWFGAGRNLTNARDSRFQTTIQGVDFTLQGFSNLTGSDYQDPALRMLATNDPEKAGSLPSWPTELRRFVQDPKLENSFVIPVIHGGQEYVPGLSKGMTGDIQSAIQDGADLVIAHHPHVVHGVWTYRRDTTPVVVVGSLGNFVFDQTIFETFHSYLAVIDLQRDAGRTRVERINLVPFRIQDFQPRPIASLALANFGRWIAQLSGPSKRPNQPGWTESSVQLQGGRIRVLLTTDNFDLKTRERTVTVKVRGGQSDPVDLRIQDNASPPHIEALSHISSDVPATCRFGRDLFMNLGSFEDHDSDDETLEGDHWSWSPYRFVQGHQTYAGAGAAALVRNAGQKSRVNLHFRSSLKVQNDRMMSLHGWQNSESAGPFELDLQWLYGKGQPKVRQTYPIEPPAHPGWNPFTIDIKAPAQSSRVRVNFYLSPNVASQASTLYLDDLSLIEWSAQTFQVGTEKVQTPDPQGWDFVRCASSAQELKLNLGLSRVQRNLSTGHSSSSGAAARLHRQQGFPPHPGRGTRLDVQVPKPHSCSGTDENAIDSNSASPTTAAPIAPARSQFSMR